VGNVGPNSATGVVLADKLPQGLTLESFTVSAGTYDSTSGTWTVGGVSTATGATLTLVARVDSPDPKTNVAMITAVDQFDPNPGNNTASVTETPQQADVSIAQTASNTSPNVGDIVTLTVTLSNQGPNAATNVAVTDLVPAGLNVVNFSVSQGQYDASTGLWDVGTVAPGSPAQLVIEAEITSPGAQTNTATITHSDQFDPTPQDSASVTLTPQMADLTISKGIDKTTPNVGDIVTYTVTLTNTGPDPATGVQVTDLLPPGVFFLFENPSQGTYNPSTDLWDVGPVAVQTPLTLVIKARVISPDPQTNSATISHSDQFDPTPGDSSSVTETPQHADLRITKTVDKLTPNVGDTVTFTVNITNTGPDAATHVDVTDLLPAGLTFVSAQPSQGTYSKALGFWAVGTLAHAVTQTLILKATVTDGQPSTNTAKVAHSDQFDPTPGDSASATATPRIADIDVSLTVSRPTPNVGDTITFVVRLVNDGPDVGHHVQVTDLLPPGLSLVSASPSQGTYDPATGLWDVGTLSVDPQLILAARVDSPRPRTNFAAITGVDEFDPEGDVLASVTETPQLATVVITKTVDQPAPRVSDTVTFTVTISNVGPDRATGVKVTDLLPSGLMLVSATPSQGTYDPNSGVWSVGQLPLRAHQTLVLAAKVISTQPQSNVATITDADQFNPNGGGSASSTETPQVVSLGASSSASDPAPGLGDTVTFTVTITNGGPADATNVQVVDKLTNGLMLLSPTPSQGTFNPVTGLWEVGTVAAGSAVTLTLLTRVIGPDQQSNTAIIIHSDQQDIDSDIEATSATTFALVTVDRLQRIGVHLQPTRLVLTFSGDLNATEALNLAHYRLIQVDRSRKPVGRSIALRSVKYDPTTNTVTLRTAHRINVHRQYELTISGLTDAAGYLIDGNRSGEPGAHFTTVFGINSLEGINFGHVASVPARAAHKSLLRRVHSHLARRA
jgi:uncharacterized repeat protein (TIGR01451 family)